MINFIKEADRKQRERDACIDLWENSKEPNVELAVHDIAYQLNMDVDDVALILITYHNKKVLKKN
jgi:hypothetical protein